MSETAWTWLLFAAEVLGVTGMAAAGRRYWWGWLVVLVHSIPWFIYAVTREKPGFIAMSLMWWTVHAVNARRWFKEDRNG